MSNLLPSSSPFLSSHSVWILHALCGLSLGLSGCSLMYDDQEPLGLVDSIGGQLGGVEGGIQGGMEGGNQGEMGVSLGRFNLY